MRNAIGQVLKAIYAGVFTTLSTLVVTLTGNQNLGDLTTLQWLLVALAGLGAFGGVYGLPGPKRPASGGGG